MGFPNIKHIIDSNAVEITDGSSTLAIASPGDNARLAITDVIISNTSVTAIEVDIRDGAGGSVKATFPVPAGAGVVHSFGTPILLSENTAGYADPSAAVSTCTVTLKGYAVSAA